MANKDENFDPQVIATTLISVVESSLKKMGSLEFTKASEFVEKDLIEYDSRMRISGLEKFNGPCYTTAISYYESKDHLKAHDACGTMVLFIEEECAESLLKALGYKGFKEEDEEMILDNCGELCNVIAGGLKSELANIGYKDFHLSAPVKERNNITGGVEFPYSQFKYHETQFELWKKRAIVVDIVMAPSALK